MGQARPAFAVDSAKQGSVMANQAPIRILAVDDHALLRKGIRMLIRTGSDMQLVAEASAGREAVPTRCPPGLGGNVLNNTASKRNAGEVQT